MLKKKAVVVAVGFGAKGEEQSSVRSRVSIGVEAFLWRRGDVLRGWQVAFEVLAELDLAEVVDEERDAFEVIDWRGGRGLLVVALVLRGFDARVTGKGFIGEETVKSRV